MIGSEERKQANITGEQKLIAAVIKTAIEDYRVGSTRNVPTIPGGYWIFKEESHRKFSFSWCCEALGLNPEYIREKIQQDNPDMDDRRYQTILWGRSKV